MGENAAIVHGEPAVVTRAHRVCLAMNAALLALKTRGLPRTELACVDAVGDASLLVEFALADGLVLRRGRGRLGDSDGGRRCECRHKDVFEESHGIFSFCDGA
jgi:hypothetical protein